MPVPTVYNKSISTDFPNGKVNTTTLSNEINTSDIVISLLRIDTEDDTCNIWFRDELSPSDVTIFDSLVSHHSGADSTAAPQTIQIVEETTGTGGHFLTKSVNILAPANSDVIEIVSWPFPISALTMKLTTEGPESQDLVNMSVGANTTVGTLLADTESNPSVWTSTDYFVGNKVLYTVNGIQRVYTCIVNTTSNQNPSNKTFWRHGFELFVSSTVISVSQLGFYMTLTNGSDTEDLGRIVYKTSSTIFVENAPTINFLAESPTYIQQTVYVLKDHYVGNGKIFSVGEGKIGGSFVPADTPVSIKYTNNSNVDKRLLGFVEFLY